jgi:hypothetical protein
MPGFALIVLDDARRGQVSHAFERTGAFVIFPPVMVLKAQVEMPPPVEGAIDARLAR